MANDLGAVARKILVSSGGLAAGERVLILARADGLDFCDALAVEAYRLGAVPLCVIYSDGLWQRALAEVPAAHLRQPPVHLVEAVKACHLVVWATLEFGDPRHFACLPQEKLAARRAGFKVMRDAIGLGGRRWIGMDLPTPGKAALHGLSTQEFERLFWGALEVDFEELRDRGRALQSALAQGTSVHIASPRGTDLWLEYGGRRVRRDDGVVDEEDMRLGDWYTNLPAGEVFLAPLEDSARGRAVVDLAFWEGHRLEALELVFERGRARAVGAGSGLELFREVVSRSSGGCDVLGELGIGINAGVSRPTGFTLTDEKIAGTVHIALGQNLMMGGANDSDLHWDLMILEPTVTVGGRKIVHRGRLMV
ncbi:MAG: aminopeptidase [Acetobacteraceae bacterium]|nr:aminopeptidase [Acetobacteraceae bacterium]